MKKLTKNSLFLLVLLLMCSCATIPKPPYENANNFLKADPHYKREVELRGVHQELLKCWQEKTNIPLDITIYKPPGLVKWRNYIATNTENVIPYKASDLGKSRNAFGVRRRGYLSISAKNSFENSEIGVYGHGYLYILVELRRVPGNLTRINAYAATEYFKGMLEDWFTIFDKCSSQKREFIPYIRSKKGVYP